MIDSVHSICSYTYLYFQVKSIHLERDASVTSAAKYSDSRLKTLLLRVTEVCFDEEINV